MKLKFLLILLACFLTGPSLAEAQTTHPAIEGKVQATPIPSEFKDPETGLRVLHLSRFPNDYSGVIYFTYNTFSADSRLTLINAQFKDKWRYLYTFDFDTLQVRPLVTDRLTQGQIVSSSGNVYYLSDHAAWVVPLKGGVPRKLCDLPVHWSPGIGFTVNANETLLIGGSNDWTKMVPTTQPGVQARIRSDILYTIEIKTGQMKIVHRDERWLGHVQFSPTDPDLCMFCEEGNWERVDRIWLISPSRSTTNADGSVTSNARIAFHRTEPREIAGHEFWQPDGKAIWFQHTYRGRPGGDFSLSSLDVSTGKVSQYIVPPGFYGIHQTFAPDGTFLISDGSGKENRGVNKYISRLTLPTDGTNRLRGEHLVTLQNHDYAVEPNPHVSPDGRWVTFTATLHGTPQAYGVELPRR